MLHLRERASGHGFLLFHFRSFSSHDTFHLKSHTPKLLIKLKSVVLSPIYPVRNDASLLCPVHHAVQGSAAGLGFRIIPAGFDAPLGFESQRLEFLTGFTHPNNSAGGGRRINNGCVKSFYSGEY